MQNSGKIPKVFWPQADIVYRRQRNIEEKYEMTTLIVTHNRGIANMADRIITMQDGKLAN